MSSATQEKTVFSIEDISKRKFYPISLDNLNQTGLNEKLIEDLIFKLLHSQGVMTGRQIADGICLQFKSIEHILLDLKQQLFLTYKSDAGLNDFAYMLTEQGRTKALIAAETSAYVGSAPIPFTDYLKSVESQSIQNETPGLEELREAFHDLVLEQYVFYTLGPAINSGRGVFLYGAPGNGKTSIAKRVHKCFKDAIYIPKTLLIGGELLKFYDPQWHNAVEDKGLQYDKRWIKVDRPAVIVGGEMDLDSLGIKYNPCTNIDPKELLDEAFLRRIPYKVKLRDPSEEKFRHIMKFLAPKYDIEYNAAMVDYLIMNYFRDKRPFRSCHPRG